jgi:hypothetical protein
MKSEDIVRSIKEIAERNIKDREKLNTAIEIAYEDIRDGNADFKFTEISESSPPHNACAIDGSRYIVPVQDNIFVIARAVLIRGNDKGNKEIPPEIEQEFKITSNYYDENIVGNKSILLMLQLETSLLDKCKDVNVIMIDGPLIDPPVYYQDSHIDGFPDLEDYTKMRATKIIEKREKSMVIGISKRFSQRLLVNYFSNRGMKQISKSTENFLLSFLFLKYRMEKEIYNTPLSIGPIEWDLFFQHERKLEDLKSLEDAYQMYREKFQESGLKLISYYYQKDFSSPIGRIDMLNLKEEEPGKELIYVNRWAVSQVKEITILNKLADDLSNVSKKESERLISLYNLFTMSNMEKEDLILKRLGKSNY